MSNVIRFPKSRIDAPTTKESIDLLNKQYKTEQVEMVLGEINDELFLRIYNMGFDITKDDVVKDVSLVVESLKSLLCKTYGLEHPLQEVSEKFITTED